MQNQNSGYTMDKPTLSSDKNDGKAPAVAPKVSVIVPLYNLAKYLPKCLDSLVRQTLRGIEIICVDDGSTDDSGKIADEYAAQDNRIRVIHQENSGASAAMNNGMAAALGEYIGFVDADDYVDLDFYETLYTAACEEGSDIAKARIVKHFADGSLNANYANFDIILENKAHFTMPFWSAIYRRELLQKNKIQFPLGIKTGQDIVWQAQAVHLSNGIALAKNHSSYHYIQRPDSMYNTMSDLKIQSRIRVANMIADFLNGRDDIDEKSYDITFSFAIIDLLCIIRKVNKMAGKLAIIDAAIALYKKCRHPKTCTLPYKKYLAAGDRYGVLEHGVGIAIKKRTISLFGILPILTTYSSRENQSRPQFTIIKLFGLLPLLKIRNKEDQRNRTIWRLFGFLPLLMIRRKPNRTVWRWFGFLSFYELARNIFSIKKILWAGGA